MKTRGRRGSSNIEDRRGQGPSVGGPIAIGGGGLGIIGIILFLLLGGDPGSLLGGGDTPTSGVQQGGGAGYVESEQEEELADFVSVVLADTEEVWSEIFRQEGMNYEDPTMVLYTGSVQSACGLSSAAVGPFYCPGDHKLYIDLSFYNELQTQFQAPGDFAMAYVIAHEVGHHVQTLLGISDEMAKVRQRVSSEEYNKYSVAMELQADYLAGVWAKHDEEKGYLDPGDFEEALRAASAVGDDTIQRRARGYAVPESFTHGTSEQRMYWFKRGYEYGDLDHGDTFTDLGL
ncbi:neutral zinc metallopeptidase [Bhargavaea ullalensis]|uniref:Metalloprotease n=1 Tax=Bhargavaea ullalensis TaxID=1265685 RepID=A0ABV2GDB3_9BACL